EAAGIKSWFQRVLDPFDGQSHTFNGSAVGDIEVYEAREAKGYANVILAGDKLDGDDLKEWQRLMRENSHDKVFSQTLLNSLGADKTLKLTNKIDDLAYYDGTKDKNVYLQINGGLADSLATATQVPGFKDASGKHLPYGSKGYNDAFDNWLRTDGAQFYVKFGNDLREHGADGYDLKAAGDKVNTVAKGHGQQVRGYQSLVTLMQQGHGYSPQFLADVTDGAIATEKDNSNVWDLYGGGFGGETGDGWFANDPVDGALGIMGRDPEAATGYLDPHASGTHDRLHYFLKERDWNVVNTTDWRGNLEVDSGDTVDGDNRVGLGAAIEAGTTGHPAGDTSAQSDGRHSAAEARVMQQTVNVLDQGTNGDSIPANLRDPIARALVDYAPDTHNTLTHDPRYGYQQGGSVFQDANGGHLNVAQDSLTRVLRGVSDNPQNFAHLYDAERAQAAHTLAGADATYSNNKDWENRVADVGMGAGVFNAIGADAILDDRDARKGWADDVARYSYHAIGTPITMIPVVGDEAQRMVDAATYEWSKDVKAEADQVANIGVAKKMGDMSHGALDLVQQWEKSRGMDYTKDPTANYLQDYMNLHYGSARDQALADLHRGLS
ncbi:DUF6571 family protein, partial [Streptomyces cellostaticus]|uniref:DUF6571 family protein n=1 Tax=Streptomyces cellostaticus TaxID=67285 RepID=UPI0020260C90